ncbi:hypothetical protein PIB30_103383 [Stylosanthes scabra]|uniref:Uncharacterized protein n=1 Tax=Stylosanthes scabra TaxID=79078 RepID=A0ABU6VY62_9FABA|nr:hypothetical protein [Stylosanthes scabra]
MVINVFKAMQYPREEDKDGCMRIDVIEELIREVQEEEAMSKLQAKQARYNDLDDTNHNFLMQKIVEKVHKNLPMMLQHNEGMQKDGTNVQKIGEEVQKSEPLVQKIDEEMQKNKEILLEENSKPVVQPQRRLNPAMKEAVQKEVMKL